MVNQVPPWRVSKRRHSLFSTENRGKVLIIGAVGFVVLAVLIVVWAPWGSRVSTREDACVEQAESIASSPYIRVEGKLGSGLGYSFSAVQNKKRDNVGTFIGSGGQPIDFVIADGKTYIKGDQFVWDSLGFHGEVSGWVVVPDGLLFPSEISPGIDEVVETLQRGDGRPKDNGQIAYSNFSIAAAKDSDDVFTVITGERVLRYSIDKEGDVTAFRETITEATSTTHRVSKGKDRKYRVV